MWLATWIAVASSGELTLPLQVGDSQVHVEVADTPDERAIGLMHRTVLAPDVGMLFIYPSESPRSFWMKDTLLPLSIAFIATDGRIVSVFDMKPLDLSPVDSILPATYALEMSQGWFATHSVQVGDQVKGLPSPSER
jgi:uncharacterized membrane protein (UPF0127 family)